MIKQARLEKIIKGLENDLLKPEVRKSKKHLDALLAYDFTEFGSSGQEYNKKEILERLPVIPEQQFEINNFKIKILSTNVVLAKYQVKKKDSKTGKINFSLRSSIWKNFDKRFPLAGKNRIEIHTPPPF